MVQNAVCCACVVLCTSSCGVFSLAAPCHYCPSSQALFHAILSAEKTGCPVISSETELKRFAALHTLVYAPSSCAFVAAHVCVRGGGEPRFGSASIPEGRVAAAVQRDVVETHKG